MAPKSTTIFSGNPHAKDAEPIETDSLCARRKFVAAASERCFRDEIADSGVGSCSQANYLLRNSAMDDSIGGS